MGIFTTELFRKVRSPSVIVRKRLPQAHDRLRLIAIADIEEFPRSRFRRNQFLVRFGTSADEHIEKAGVWRDRSFDIGALSRSVTVTTIARFAYDGFAGEHGKKLYEMKWDVIVFDEASMISLASIIYPLYRQKPQKFIIAGDPFQIEPIVAVEQWRDENIYTLVGLNRTGSFAKPVGIFRSSPR